MKITFITIFLLFSFFIKAQNVNIYITQVFFNNQAKVLTLYEPLFGAGNVNVTVGAALSDYSSYDIVIFNGLGQSYPVSTVNALVSFVQNGGHVCLSSEGSTVGGGAMFMSSVWNNVTGQNITETGAGASGTSSPPRFHNSLGPWHSSPNASLSNSTTSYASFANLNPLNVTHQRNLTAPTCGNIQGLSAVYPSRPNLGDGTLYIQGEVQYPYFANSAALDAHVRAIAKMHHTLLTNNQTELDILNTWEANLVVDDDFIGNDTTICKSSFVPFTRNSPLYESYSWEDVSGNILATTPAYTITDSGTYIIRTTGTFPQCDGIDTLHVRFNSSPVSSFRNDTVCFGNNTNFLNTSSIDAPDVIFSTTWDFGDGATSNTMNVSHLFSSEGIYNVKLTSISDKNCSHDTTINVIVKAEPIASFYLPNDCLYNNPNITEESSIPSGNIVSWQWNFGDGISENEIQSTEQVPSHTYSTPGDFDVKLIVVSDLGCDDTLVVTTTRHPIPQINFLIESACKNDSVEFINNSTINAPDNITSWVWNFGDGSSLSSEQNPKHKYTTAGIFSVTLTASSNNDCVSEVSNLAQSYPLPVAEFTSTSTCENAQATSFFNTSNVSQGSIDSYFWDFDDNGSTSTSQFASHNYLTAGNYDVKLVVETDHGCKDSINHNVEVLQKPQAIFTADKTEGCFPYCVNFQDNSESNASSVVSYFWIFGNGVVETISNPQVCFDNISYTDDAKYNVTLIATNDLGCKDTVSILDYITVWPKPLALFEVSPEETNMYYSDIEFVNLSEGGDSYLWNYGDGDSIEIFEEIHNYSDTGKYEIELITTTEKGCRDTVYREVNILPVPNVYIPSAFTPNGDGINDYFFVDGFAIDSKDFSFSIFDRWGQLIYTTKEFIPWDGTFKGKKAKQDTYIYEVRLLNKKGEIIEYRGHVTLLR